MQHPTLGEQSSSVTWMQHWEEKCHIRHVPSPVPHFIPYCCMMVILMVLHIQGGMKSYLSTSLNSKLMAILKGGELIFMFLRTTLACFIFSKVSIMTPFNKSILIIIHLLRAQIYGMVLGSVPALHYSQDCSAIQL